MSFMDTPPIRLSSDQLDCACITDLTTTLSTSTQSSPRYQCQGCGSYGERHICEYCGTVLNAHMKEEKPNKNIKGPGVSLDSTWGKEKEIVKKWYKSYKKMRKTVLSDKPHWLMERK